MSLLIRPSRDDDVAFIAPEAGGRGIGRALLMALKSKRAASKASTA